MRNPSTIIDDVSLFLQAAASGPLRSHLERRKWKRDRFVQEVLAASRGNFMYVRALTDEVLSGREYSLTTLPAGLDGYYERHWDELRAETSDEEWDRRYLPVLRVLCSAEFSVDVQELCAILNPKWTGRPQPSETELRRVLERWGQFLSVGPGPRGSRYGVYHRSFQEFLSAKEEVGGDDVRRATGAWISNALVASLDHGGG